MSEEAQKQESETQEIGSDDYKNLKSEMGRKMENVQSQLQQMAQAQQALLSQIQQSQSSRQPESSESKSLSDKFYEDPEEYTRQLLAEADARAEKRVQERMSQQQSQQAELASLAADYPELHDKGNDLTKRAVEIFNGFDESTKNSSIAYRLAVKEAASEMGVKPSSKRNSNEDDGFTLSSSSGKTPKRRRRAEEAEDELDQRTIDFAEAVGMDVSDPDVIKRLKERSKRNYGKYR